MQQSFPPSMIPIVRFLAIFVFLFSLNAPLFSQESSPNIRIDYMLPKEYEIADITVKGADLLDHQLIILFSGLSVGEKVMIPGDKITSAIDKLWKQGYFEDIKIVISKIEGKSIFFEYQLRTKPTLHTFTFEGVGKHADKIREKINLSIGDVITENKKINISNKIKEFFISKGYFNCEVEIQEFPDTSSTRGDINLKIIVDKKDKVKIKEIIIHGNDAFSNKKIERALKETKRANWWRFWKKSRFIEKDFHNDLNLLVNKYNTEGFRNARIVKDSLYTIDDKYVNLELTVHEGDKFFFRNITWVGNTKHSSKDLSRRLRISKGDPYNSALLERNLSYDPTGIDISALYQDDGYLFFQAIPTEVKVEKDSIDIEIRLYEGKQARIRKISLSGNSRTNDRVIMREIRTLPGQLYSREAVLRSIRELGQLQFFSMESLHSPDILPDPQRGTVDITYNLEEQMSAKLELSGGYGGFGAMFSVGVDFNNFSMQNFFNKKAWNPLPSGDGQRLSIRLQTNGRFYHSVNVSFTEPWLGGRKPNALTTSFFYSYSDDGFFNNLGSPNYYLGILGASVSLATRLEWPDDFFTLMHGVSYQQYNVKNYTSFIFSDGRSNNLGYNLTFGRNSTDDPIYSRSGSSFSISTQATLPYSLFSTKDISTLSNAEKFKWLEYYKVNLRLAWFFNPVDELVFSARSRFGFLGYYNKDIGYPPFERFYLGGDGLNGWALDGREIVSLRGYDAGSLSPATGASVFEKFTLEMRYPAILKPMMSIFALCFVEAGKSWGSFHEFNPFQTHRSAGVGIRLFLPQLGGLIGLDWGYGFDPIPGLPKAHGSHFHFSLNQSID